MNGLICPNCGTKLHKQGNSLLCENKHCYDIAKEGYVNLLAANDKHSKEPGDNKEMIAARKRLMQNGYYKKLGYSITNIVCPQCPCSVLDIGAGEGYLSREIYALCNNVQVVGLDVSKAAIQCAAKANKNITYAVGSANKLPIASASVDVAINVFAPVFADELLRVLKKSALFIKVIPNKNHLFSLKRALYDAPYPNEVTLPIFNGLTLINQLCVTDSFTAAKDLLQDLISMTPYGYTTSPERIKNVVASCEITTELEFIILIYKVD